MATPRQKRLARAIVENMKAEKPRTKQDLAEEAGYSEKTADRNVAEIFDSPGVKEELVILGFDEESAKDVVREILGNKREAGRTRLSAADMIFKVHGTYAPEKKDITVKAEPSEEDKALAKKLEELERDNG